MATNNQSMRRFIDFISTFPKEELFFGLTLETLWQTREDLSLAMPDLGPNPFNAVSERLLRGDQLTDSEIRKFVLSGIPKSNIEGALKKPENQRTLARIFRGGHTIRQLLQEERFSILSKFIQQIPQFEVLREELRTDLGILDWQIEQLKSNLPESRSEAVSLLQSHIQHLLRVVPQMGPVSKGSIFLSYARADDEQFASKLYQALTSRGFAVWWDRASMPNRGLMFMSEIHDAIKSADRVLLVWGPGALSSDYVRAEWDHAHQHLCKPVVTVLRLGNYETIPEDLKAFDIPDFRDDGRFEKQLEYLVRQIEPQGAPLGELPGVPPLPDQHVPRTGPTGDVKAHLIAHAQAPVAPSSTPRKAGFFGMGGSGKSVLAAAVARDCDVRRVFEDGIFWINLGGRYMERELTDDASRRGILKIQSSICESLGGEYKEFDTIEEARRTLAKLLSNKKVLFILDDTSTAEQLNAFDVLQYSSGLLVTTRNETLLPAGTFKHELGMLAPDEARSLVAKWMIPPEEALNYRIAEKEKAISESLPDIVDQVLNEVGYLPLAIALCAANFCNGMAWEYLFEALQDARLDFIDHAHGSVMASLRVSLNRLRKENAEYAKHYIELAVFARAKRIPENAAIRFWLRTGSLRRYEVEKLLITLKNRALIQLEGEPPNRQLILHDLQHDYLLNECDDVQDLHAELVEAYRSDTDGAWHSCTDDGYIFENLVYHLFEAGLGKEAFALLTGSKHWQVEKSKIKGFSTFVDDLQLAIGKAKLLPEADYYSELFKLNAAWHVTAYRARNYFDIDLETLVYLGRDIEALGCARLRPGNQQRMTSLIAIRDALFHQERTDTQVYNQVILDMLHMLSEDQDGSILPEVIRTLSYRGELRRAEQIIDKAPGTPIYTLEAMTQLGKMFLQSGQPEEASRIGEKVQKLAVEPETLEYGVRALALFGDSTAFSKKTADEVWDPTGRLNLLAYGLECFPDGDTLGKDAETWLLVTLPDLKSSYIALSTPLEEIFLRLSGLGKRDVVDRVLDSLLGFKELQEAAIILAASQGRDLGANSIFEKGTASNHRLAKAWVVGKVWDKAHEAAKQIPKNDWRRVDTLGILGSHLSKENMSSQASQTFSEASKTIDDMSLADWNKSASSSRLARYLAQGGLMREATEEFERAEALMGTVIDRIDAPPNPTAYDVNSITSGAGEEEERARLLSQSAGNRLGALLTTGQTLVRFGDIESGKKVFAMLGLLCEQISSVRRRVSCLGEVAEGFSSVGMDSQCEHYVQKVLKLLNNFPPAESIRVKPDDYFRSLCNSIVLLHNLGKRDEALSIFRLAQDELWNPRTSNIADVMAKFISNVNAPGSDSARCRFLTGCMVRIKQYDTAMKILTAYFEPRSKREGDREGLVDQFGRGLVEILVPMSRDVPNEAIKAWQSYAKYIPIEHEIVYLVRLAKHLEKFDKRDVAAKQIESAMRSLEVVTKAKDKSESYTLIASYYQLIGDEPSALEMLREARRFAESIPLSDEGPQLREAIERGQVDGASMEEIKAMNEAVEKMKNLNPLSHKDRSWALKGVAIGLAKAGRFDDAREIIPQIWYEWKGQARNALTNSLAAAYRFEEAFRLLREDYGVDGFISAVHDWIDVLPGFESSAKARMFIDTLRIAGWVRTDWREVYELIKLPESI